MHKALEQSNDAYVDALALYLAILPSHQLRRRSPDIKHAHRGEISKGIKGSAQGERALFLAGCDHQRHPKQVFQKMRNAGAVFGAPKRRSAGEQNILDALRSGLLHKTTKHRCRTIDRCLRSEEHTSEL